MAAETIQKLEPHRTMHLRGVDRFGAMGSLWGASATGFSVSGVFRDMADFAVLMLWDADDYFGHWQSTKYLPDFDFTNMVLSFDVHASGVQPLDSPAYQWIPWRSLSYVLSDGQPGTVDLQPHATYVSGTHTAASATLTLTAPSPAYGDEITLWYQNIAFDYVVQGGLSGSATYFYQNAPSTASITVNGTPYTYSITTPGGESGGTIAAGVAAAAAADPLVAFSASGNAVNFTSKVNTGASVNVLGYILWLVTDPPATFIAANLVSQINGFSWGANSLPLSATASSGTITVTCTVPGADGNLITLYAISKNADLAISPSVAPLTGGVSDATWNVTVDFSALGISHLKQAWLTFAPQIQHAIGGNPWPIVDYQDTEWLVTVTNWSVTDPNGVRPLKIAGAGSVRVGSRDSWVTYAGSSWIEEASNQPGGTGWFNKGFAHRMSTTGDSVTVKYACQFAHKLYIGTSLYTDRGIVSVTIDGVAGTPLDCFYNQATAPVVTRRLLSASAISAGTHTVTFSLQSGNHAALGAWDANSGGHYFYFDFLEAAVLADVPDPANTYSSVMPATDFDTDHGYKLSPQRLVWMLQRLGFAGQINHYMGVFWWNQRQRVGGTFPVATITFGGTWAGGDSAFVTVDTQTIGKSVFAADTAATIAAHFAYFINSGFTGLRASASGGVLTIVARTPEFAFALSTSKSSTAGTMTSAGSLSGGVEGTWQINDAATPVLNRAVTDWHMDFWAQVAVAGLTGVASFSMELTNPPDNPGGGIVYAQRFPDGTAVTTDTGFGGLKSTQCTFNTTFRSYQQKAFKEMAAMMSAAGLTPWLQFGEFLWWFFAKAQNIGIGYASYTSPISIGTTVPHGLSTGQKVVNDGVRGNTAANGVFTITVTDFTHFTLDGSSGNGTYTGGGYVTGGGMAFYDADTAAAAVTALGRALATFSYPNDNPNVNSYADANFLRGLIYAHASAIATYVKATYPTAQFEVLWPYDVNHPTPTALARLGGQLNRYVNLPSQWQTLSGSGLNRMKVESLAFGATERSLTLAKQAIAFPMTAPLTWPLADTAYLIPIFNGGCPWPLEFLAALGTGTPLVNFWAFDHFCLLSWPLPMPKPGSSAQIH